MLLLKYLLLSAGVGLFAAAAAILVYDLYRVAKDWQPGREKESHSLRSVRWHPIGMLASLAWLPLLPGLSIIVVPSGMAAVRVSQFSGTIPGTLYPGTHLIVPLVHSVEFYNIREHVFTTTAEDPDDEKGSILTVQSKEGLPVGLCISVRYRLDPVRLDYVHNNLPTPVEIEIVPPVVASVFRQIVPNYMVREVFSTKREEVLQSSSEAITSRLESDAILVREVMVREIILPPEYAKGLEGLLLKEQENERMAIELEVKKKRVLGAELEADADKVRQIKNAEAKARVTVLQAKAKADAMEHTLPLKEKQIQQSRLEAEAHKEATIQNAEAAAAAKVIDSRAELERRNLLSQAEETRIRLLAGADAERLRTEAKVLKENPLLIQKIIAERLSDKLQIMMVPMDGKFFFANDVLRSSPLTLGASQRE